MAKKKLDIKSVDFGIITIREDEFLAVLKRFVPIGYVRKRRRYEIASVKTPEGKTVSVAIVMCIEQGRAVAQHVATDLIEDLDPSCLLLVGICGATPSDDFTLGDVVCASRVHDYSVRACVEGKNDSFAVSGGSMHYIIKVFLSNLPARQQELKGWNLLRSIGMQKPKLLVPPPKSLQYYGDNAWQDKVHKSLMHHFPRRKHSRPPLFTTRPVISSDVLVKSSSLLEQWQESSHDAASVEMELGGIYEAADRYERQVPILAVRGISDIIGFKRENDWTRYACHSAASFALASLKAGASELMIGKHTDSAASSDDVRNNVMATTPNYLIRSSRPHFDARVTTLNLRIMEDKNATEESILRIVDAGVFLWQEANTDSFWLRLLFVPKICRLPRLRVTCDQPCQVRDFSHAFFAKDNLLRAEQCPDMARFKKNSTVISQVPRPRPGEETNRYCYAHWIPFVVQPLRAYIEQALSTVVYVEPRDFLTYERVSKISVENDCVFGLWLLCRLSERVIRFPGTLEFKIFSNISMDYFRFQSLLPLDIEVAFSKCVTSDNIFMPWVNSNPHVNFPGLVSLINASDSGNRVVPVFYTIQAPFFEGQLELVCQKRKHTIKKVALSPSEITFSIDKGQVKTVFLDFNKYLIALLLTAQYKEKFFTPLSEKDLARAYRELHLRFRRHLRGKTLTDLQPLVADLRDAIMKTVKTALRLEESREVIAKTTLAGPLFTLLQDRLENPENILFSSDVPYDMVRKTIIDIRNKSKKYGGIK